MQARMFAYIFLLDEQKYRSQIVKVKKSMLCIYTVDKKLMNTDNGSFLYWTTAHPVDKYKKDLASMSGCMWVSII